MRNIKQMLLKTAVKICIIAAVIFLCLGGCRYIFNTLFNMVNWEYIATIYHELKEEEKSYAKGENTITNGLGEVYKIKYKEYFGFPDMGMTVEISADHPLIKYDLDFGLSSVPDRVMYLFGDGSLDYYYAGNEHDFIFVYDRLTQRGDRLSFFEKPRTGSMCEGNISLSQTFQRNIRRSELTEKFRVCGYNDTFILKVYDYSS